MRPPRALLAAALLLACALPAAAQDVLETRSGSRFEGEIVADDGSTVEFRTTDGATMKLPWAHLTPASQYLLKRKATTQDGPGLLGLAEWCVEQTLYDEAKLNYRKALEVAPLMADRINASVAKARTTAANEVLARAKGLQAGGKAAEARALLTSLVQELPLEEASKEAAQLLAADTAQRKSDSLKRKPASGGKEAPAANAVRSDGEPFSEATRTLFGAVITSYHQMLDATQKGLTEGGNAGIKEFEKALKEGDKIRKAAEKIRKDKGQDAEVAEALALVDEKLEEADVDARCNIVDTLLLRNTYNQASDVANAGLAVYPKNGRLLAAKDKCVSAASGRWGGGWIGVGPRH